MKKHFPRRVVAIEIPAVLLLVFLTSQPKSLAAKDKTLPPDPNDVTYRLFQLLDDSHSGKLANLYVIADTYKDPGNSDGELQHILLVDYDKNRNFGKLNIHVRCLSKLAPEQLKTYTLKQIFDFGVEDTEKFVKTDPGSFGRPGDMFLRATGEMPPSTAPITDDARKQYDFFLTQFLIPALAKKPSPDNAAQASH